MTSILQERARILKQNSTDPEHRMWYFLRDRRLNGHKFVRQHIIAPYIVDFICREKNLIIELDGSQHLDAQVYDQKRTEYLEKKGYKVVRVWNNEVLNNINNVLEMILQYL